MKSTKQSDETQIALINNNVSIIQTDVSIIKRDIKDMAAQFISRTEFTDVVKVQADHETRIRDSEKSLWKYVGVFSVVSVIITLVLPIIVKDIFK